MTHCTELARHFESVKKRLSAEEKNFSVEDVRLLVEYAKYLRGEDVAARYKCQGCGESFRGDRLSDSGFGWYCNECM